MNISPIKIRMKLACLRLHTKGMDPTSTDACHAANLLNLMQEEATAADGGGIINPMDGLTAFAALVKYLTDKTCLVDPNAFF
jgi:hypothetical protein